MTWRVKVTRDFRAYEPVSCQHLIGEAGAEVVGELARLFAEQVPSAVEVLDKPAAAPTWHVVSTAAPAPAPAAAAADGEFDPSAANGPDVVQYVKDHPEQAAAVLAAERAGKARTTVLAALESLV